MKKILFLFIIISQVLSSQISRNMLQDYNTIALLRAETILPKANDKVFVRDSQFIYWWDKNSTLTDDGYFVIKQTNQSTGRYRLVLSYNKQTIDSTTAINGLTETGNQISLGGALITPTTITSSLTNTLAVAGLQSGTNSDSLVVADATTGVLKRISWDRNNANDWHILGNTGTTPTTNFLGTIDNQDLVFRTNNIPRFRIFNNTSGARYLLSNMVATNGGTEGSIYMGHLVGNATTNSYANTVFGIDILQNATTPIFNTAFGQGLLKFNLAGMFNCIYGHFSGGTGTGFSDVCAFGYNTLGKNTTSRIVAFGNNAGANQTAASGNSYFGDGAGQYNVIGIDNTYGGFLAGNNGRGSFNTAWGARNFQTNLYSSSCTVVGQENFSNLRGGDNNVSIGRRNAIGYFPGTNTLDSSLNSVYIGNYLYPKNNNAKNVIMICGTSGNGTVFYGDGDSTTKIGNMETKSTEIPNGKLGINLGNQIIPNSTVHIYGNIAIRDTTVITANYTMSAGNDPTNVLFRVGASGTINLTAGAVRSREYHLINYSGVSLTLGTTVRTATGATTLILPADEKYIIYWNGTEWIRK